MHLKNFDRKVYRAKKKKSVFGVTSVFDRCHNPANQSCGNIDASTKLEIYCSFQLVCGRKKTDKHRITSEEKKKEDISLMQRITRKGERSSKDNKDFKSD